MNQEVLILLQKEIDLLDTEIANLLKRQEGCQEAMTILSRNTGDSIKVQKKTKVIRDTPPVKNKTIAKVKKTLPSPDTRKKFAHYLIDIFKASKPESIFYSAELCSLVKEGIDSGKCKEGKKDLTSAVSAYLWNFINRGLIKKIEKGDGDRSAGYQYIGKEGIAKSGKKGTKSPDVTGLDELDTYDEAIIDIVENADNISLMAICHDLRMTAEYAEISKNLNGTLQDSVTKKLDELCKNNILIYSGLDETYSVNPKANL